MDFILVEMAKAIRSLIDRFKVKPCSKDVHGYDEPGIDNPHHEIEKNERERRKMWDSLGSY